MEGTGQLASRKVYSAPKLVVYGSVTDLTQGYGSGQPDNGNDGPHRKKPKKSK